MIAPVGELTAAGLKTLENRVWSHGFRGQFLIHASTRHARNFYADIMSRALRIHGTEACASIPSFKACQRGGFIGVARVAGIIMPKRKEPMPMYPLETDRAWHFFGGKSLKDDQYGFLIRDARPIPFFPWRGRLGFFDVPDAVAREALAAAA